MALRLFFLLCCGWLLAGCASMDSYLKKFQPPELPVWVESPPSDQMTLYSVGQGYSLIQAEENARHSLAAQIQNIIASKEEVYVIQDGDYSNQYFRHKSENTVSTLILSGIKVIKTANTSDNFYVLISLDKQTMINQQNDQLAIELETLKNGLAAPAELDFEHWWQLMGLAELVASVEAKVATIKAFTGSAPLEAQEALTVYHRDLQGTASNRQLRFSNRTQSKELDTLIRSQLETHGVAVGRGFWGAQPELEMNVEYRSQTIQQEVHTDGLIRVVLKGKSGGVLAQREWRADAVALEDSRQSQQRVNKKLHRQLSQENIIDQLLKVSHE